MADLDEDRREPAEVKIDAAEVPATGAGATTAGELFGTCSELLAEPEAAAAAPAALEVEAPDWSAEAEPPKRLL